MKRVRTDYKTKSLDESTPFRSTRCQNQHTASLSDKERKRPVRVEKFFKNHKKNVKFNEILLSFI